MNTLLSLASAYSRNRFACVFFSLLITLAASPVLTVFRADPRISEALVALSLLAALLSVTTSVRWQINLVILAAIVFLRGIYGIMGYEPFLSASQAMAAIACLFSGLILLRFTLSKGSVDAERIFAALSVYLLAGIVFALCFFILEELSPGSINFPDSLASTDNRIQLAHCIYFSFVTLGTLGYGDLTPVSGPARALAVTEAILGQMYLAVVVARLVSLYRTE